MSREEAAEWHKQESEGRGVISSADVEEHERKHQEEDQNWRQGHRQWQPEPFTRKTSPAHYEGEVQCIDAMRQIASPEAFVMHCRLTALKYLWRAGDKPGESLADDLGKARVYAGWGEEWAKEHGL